MNIHRDFEEFLELLNKEKVDFVIVGGYAVAFHGYIRATQDIDLFFKNTDDNIHKIQRALTRFGITTSADQAREFRDAGAIIRIGVAPVLIEMINTISGLSFDEVWERRVQGRYGKVTVHYISFKDLLINKKESGRPKDIADFDELGGNKDS